MWMISFFLSNAMWLSPGRLSNRKDNWICKFTELKQWQHQSWRQSAYKRELNWIGTSIELSPCNQKSKQSKSPKPNKHTKTPKQTTNKKPARSVVS